MRRGAGVIVYLAQARHSSYGRDSLKLLRGSISSLVENYLAAHKDDVMFLHFGEVPLSEQRTLVALCGEGVYARFLTVPANYSTVPAGTPEKQMHSRKFSIGYRHMIRLYTIGLWHIVAREGYEYVMRMDEDSFILSPISYNIFDRMRTEGIDYAYRLASWEQVSGRNYPFHRFLQRYLQSRKEWLSPTWLLDSCVDRTSNYTYENCGHLYGFYNNFFVTRVAFWLQPRVQDWLQYADASHKIYVARWNDILWQSAAVQMFMPLPRVRMLRDFAYEHATFFKIRNGSKLDPNDATATAGSLFPKEGTSRCIFYGGLAIGTSRSSRAKQRLAELIAMPACRIRSVSRTAVRPCLRLEHEKSSKVASPSALMMGGVSEQEPHCSRPEPRPFYCGAGTRESFANAGTHRGNAETMRMESECSCAPGMATRSSVFAKCYCGVLAKLPLAVDRSPRRNLWECHTVRQAGE